MTWESFLIFSIKIPNFFSATQIYVRDLSIFATQSFIRLHHLSHHEHPFFACNFSFQNQNFLLFHSPMHSLTLVKFGSIDSHSPMRGHMGHPEASQGDLENQPVL
jgi:hypothetical protein